MGTMPGKSPAIMQSPNHGDVRLLQEAEQHLVVHIEAMQRVKMDHIGRKGADLPNEFSGRRPGIQSRVIGEARHGIMKVISKRPGHSHRIRSFGPFSRTI